MHNVLHLLKNRNIQILYKFLFFLLPAIIVMIAIKSPGIDGYERARLGDMIIGRAHKPFVYRALIPSTVRVIKSFVPRNIRSTLNDMVVKNKAAKQWIDELHWDSYYLIEIFIVVLIMYTSLLAFQGSLKYFIEGIYDVPEYFGNYFSLISLVLLPLFFKYYTYIYDFPGLFLFTLGLGLMVRKHWELYLIVFILACWNKETSILLTMIYFIHFFWEIQFPKAKEKISSFMEYLKNVYNGEGKYAITKVLLLQAVFFILIKAVLYVVFWNNPGTGFEYHLEDYNLILFRKMDYIRVAIIATIIGYFIFLKWNEKPAFLRNSLWIAVPLLILTLFFGFLDEYRDYYELFPIVYLLIIVSICQIMKFKLVERCQNNGF